MTTCSTHSLTPSASCSSCASIAADSALIETLLKTIRPEHLALLKVAVPPDLYARVAERAKKVVR